MRAKSKSLEDLNKDQLIDEVNEEINKEKEGDSENNL